MGVASDWWDSTGSGNRDAFPINKGCVCGEKCRPKEKAETKFQVRKLGTKTEVAELFFGETSLIFAFVILNTAFNLLNYRKILYVECLYIPASFDLHFIFSLHINL